MTTLYVIGGQQRAPRALLSEGTSWYDYQKGVILRVDTETGGVDTIIEYVSPSEACGAQDPILFKSGTRCGDLLYCCTQTEIVIYALPHFDRVGYISLPCFNDVHHVVPTPDGTMLVANSGLETVLELTHDGEIVNEWNVLGQDTWSQFSKHIDYRRGISTKPHRAHPNFVFLLDDQVWVTRFELKDAICLTRPGARLALAAERVHDGLLHDGLLYFTAVNAQLITADPQSLTVQETIDLTTMSQPDTLPGWCRGVWMDGAHAWVGFSRIRPTKFRQAVSWVRLGMKHSMPTHIACYDLARREKIRDIDLEPYGMNAIFSILPAKHETLPALTKVSPRAESCVPNETITVGGLERELA